MKNNNNNIPEKVFEKSGPTITSNVKFFYHLCEGQLGQSH
jgi:hypothetical protein